MVERRWPNSTIVCMAPGPSLTREDAARVRGVWPVIVINDAVQIAPWADVLYSSDQYWFPRHRGVPTFAGRKVAIYPDPTGRYNPFARYPAIQVLRNTGDEGLELAPDGLRTGKNSGYAAINLAVHLGATRIVLLGYDMAISSTGATHFDNQFRGPRRYADFRPRYQTLVAPLRAAGVTVINCSRKSALRCFPRVQLQVALAAEVAA